MSKVLVTGAAGYIGAHTAVALVQRGIETVLLDDLSRSNDRLIRGIRTITGRELPFYKVDCNNEQALRGVLKQHPDISHVIHFAAYKSVNESVREPLSYFRNNIGSLLTLLEEMEQAAIDRLIFSSSCTVYGQPDIIPVTEDTPFRKAESPYGATKQMGERMIEDAVLARQGLRAVSLRYFNPIGAHPSGHIGELPIGVPNNLVPYITQTAIGKRDSLVIFGSDYQTPDGTCLRDFIHVVDLAEAHVQAVEQIDRMPHAFEPINVGTGNPVSVLELVKSFIRVTGVPLKYSIGPRRAGDIEKVYADVTKSGKLLHWKSRISIDDALRDAWRWEQNLAHATY